MGISMTDFLPDNMVKPCGWLGKRKWVRFEHPDERWIISANRRTWDEVPLEEKERTKFRAVRGLLFDSYKSDKELLLTYALSRSVAFGPKVFQPSAMQCRALENTGCEVPFEQYAQPYETLLIKFPEEYRQMKREDGMNRCPRYVISWYDRDLGMILVACQFENQNDRIVGILNVKEDQTIEDVLSAPSYYESDGTVAREEVEDFQIAQLFERIAINLNMLMMYGGSKLAVHHHDPEGWKRYRELKRRYEKQRNKLKLMEIKDWSVGQMDEIIMDQEIGFRVQTAEAPPPNFTGCSHPSPKPHWRRGHWVNQSYGPRHSLRKPLLRAPIYVIGRPYRGADIDLEGTSVVYQQEGEHWQGTQE